MTVTRTPRPEIATVYQDATRILINGVWCRKETICLDDLEAWKRETGMEPAAVQPWELAEIWPPGVMYETILRKETGDVVQGIE